MRRFAILLALPILLSLSAPAQPSPGGQGGRRGQMLHRALSALDLSDAQKAQLREMRDARKPALQALRQKAQTDRQKLDGLLAAPKPDFAAIGAAFYEVHKNRQAAKVERDAIKQDFEKILTPEQRAELRGMIKAGSGRFGPGLGHRAHAGGER